MSEGGREEGKEGREGGREERKEAGVKEGVSEQASEGGGGEGKAKLHINHKTLCTYRIVLPTCLTNSLYRASLSVEKAAPSSRMRHVENAIRRSI